MFESNRINNPANGQKLGIPVRIVLDDGSGLRGKIMVSKSRTIKDELNHGGQFVVVHPYGAEPILLAKTALRSLSLINVPQTSLLQRRGLRKNEFDPYEVLGLVHGAGRDLVDVAYLKLARAYHPDRYVDQDLPDEILKYASTMLMRIELAYEELTAIHSQIALEHESNCDPAVRQCSETI